MNNPSAALTFKVGLTMVLAIALIAFGYSFWRGQFKQSNTYRLTLIVKDAQGIETQDKVYLAGVKVGEVNGVALGDSGREAIISLIIKNQFHIPQGSLFVITASLLSGEADVNIVPPQKQIAGLPANATIPPGATVFGSPGLNAASLEADASNILRQFNKTTTTANNLLQNLSTTVTAINKIVTAPSTQNSLIDTVKNINAASAQGLELTKELRTDLQADNGQVQSTLHSVNQASGTVNDVATANKQKLNKIIDNLNTITGQVATLTQNANSTFTKGGTLQNFSDTAANLKDATIKLNAIEANIQSITGDPKIQAELRNTLDNASKASENASVLVSRLTALTGSRPHLYQKGDLKFVSRLDFTQNFRSNNFRTDFNLFAPISNSDFAMMGVYDLTESNKLNFEFGQTNPLNKFVTYRAGVYDGKIGVGADYDLFGNKNFSLNIYDPNHVRADFRQRIPVNSQSAFYLGLTDFPRTNAITLGFQLQR